MFKDVKVGDRLYSVEDGWGILETICTRETYPLTIRFDSRLESFTLEGKRYIGSKNPTLFLDKIEFKIPKKSLPDLKVGTAVLVWEGEGHPKKNKQFKKFTKKGKMVCFESGYAGMYNCVSKWKYWELAE